MKNVFFRQFCFISLFLIALPAAAADMTIAAAADLKYALDDVIADFQKNHAGNKIHVIYGSSGKLHTQIQQGAPYDIFFSADKAFALSLEKAGFAASAVEIYAIGRIVLWTTQKELALTDMPSLTTPRIKRIAIANPKHAPYGQRAIEALKSAQIFDEIKTKLVYGDNVLQTLQFVQSGNAEAGIIALSLALSPALRGQGTYFLIPENLHQPLEQAYLITRYGKDKALALLFFQYVATEKARQIMEKNGFSAP